MQSPKRLPGLVWLAIAVLAGLMAVAQLQGQKQDIPDAPSTVQPPPPPPAPEETPKPDDTAATPPPAPATTPETAPATTAPANPSAPPPLRIVTVPDGGASQEEKASQEDLFRIVRPVNQVMVPVMVKDVSGRLVDGLLPKDFSVLEDGVRQKMNFFTSDPFPLSAAVLIDTGMPDVAVQKVNQTYSALEGAFSQFDEVAVYTFSSTVSRAMDYSSAGKSLTATLNSLKTVTGSNNGIPVTSGPLGPQGPTVNNIPVQPQTPNVITPPRVSRVLNDAVLMAALDLGKREKARRKIIFIISDGREYGSNASYADVLKVLLSNGITVFGVAVEGSAMPVYGRLQKLHIPKTPAYTNILPKYSNATGGWIYSEFSRDSIGNAYAQVTGDARNQYTLGYTAKMTPSLAYRSIEVRVARPDVKVYAKDGYYPLPPGK